jgi:hypothetical protein
MVNITRKRNAAAIRGIAIVAVTLLISTSMTVTMNIGYVSGKEIDRITEERTQMVTNRISQMMPDSGQSSHQWAAKASQQSSAPAVTKSPETTISSAPSVTRQGGDFQAQAALLDPFTTQSTNLMFSKAIYEIGFTTQTSGTIHEIEMEFPAGTNLDARILIERVGIGGGTLDISGNSLIYRLDDPVSVPAGTFIRLEIGNIKNPQTVDTQLAVTITTMGSAGSVIDGPTQTNAYFVHQIGTVHLANGAVTTGKIANDAITASKVSPSFMKSVTLTDGQSGWNPNGIQISFAIAEPAATASNTYIYVGLEETSLLPVACTVQSVSAGTFTVACEAPPGDGSKLRYTVIKQ